MKHSARPESVIVNLNAESSEYSCPAAPAVEGSEVFAATGYDGRSYHFKTKFRLPKELLNDAVAGNWEKRFRFTGSCQEGSCKHWQDGDCALSQMVIHETNKRALKTLPLPECAIRESCRWYSQDQEAACSVCSYVVSGASEREICVVE